MGRSDLKELIRQAARDLGFLSVGFSRAGSIPDNRLREWLERGYHGKMAYLERNLNRRLDPREIMETVKTVISLNMGYLSPGGLPYSDDRRGVISRYAAFKDYHHVLDDRLTELCCQIHQSLP